MSSRGGCEEENQCAGAMLQKRVGRGIGNLFWLDGGAVGQGRESKVGVGEGSE